MLIYSTKTNQTKLLVDVCIKSNMIPTSKSEFTVIEQIDLDISRFINKI